MITIFYLVILIINFKPSDIEPHMTIRWKPYKTLEECAAAREIINDDPAGNMSGLCVSRPIDVKSF